MVTLTPSSLAAGSDSYIKIIFAMKSTIDLTHVRVIGR